MIVLVPVTRFRVNYKLAEGLPYSHLDRLVLEAVNENLTSLRSLETTFELHPRLIVQSLVTLTQAGWIALGSSPTQQFVLTPAGRKALEKTDLPEWREITSRTAYVLLDCVTGAVVLENQVQYVSRWLLEKNGVWDRDACLRAEVFDGRLDASEVYHLLPRRQGQRLLWVGPIELVSKFSHYLTVEVDPDSGSILGLPRRLEMSLRLDLVDKAREVTRRRGEDVLTKTVIQPYVKEKSGRSKTDSDRRRTWPVKWTEDDLLVTHDQHLSFLDGVFQRAKSVILVASSCVDVHRLERFRAAIWNALERGVDVQLLRGYASDSDSLNWMKKLAYDATQHGLTGKLYFNKECAPSNVRIVLWDEDQNDLRGTIGSFDWLASVDPDDQNTSDSSLSVKISHASLIEALTRCVASVWRNAESESLSSVPGRWEKVAAMLEDISSGVECDDDDYDDVAEVTKMRVVLNHELPSLFRQWAQSTQSQLCVLSERLDETGRGNLELLAQSISRVAELKVIALYGQSDSSEQDISLMPDNAEDSRVILRRIPSLNTNLILSDLSACVGSYRFLSGPHRGDMHIREVGLEVAGVAPLTQLSEYVARLTK